MMKHHHSLLGEATDAGFLGATAVAVLFFIRDALNGKPLLTPSVLGQALLLGQSTPNTSSLDFEAILLYTGFHFIAFLLLGLVAAWLVRHTARRPVLLFGLFVLFVLGELFFLVLVGVLPGALNALFPTAWVLFANLLAALVMGWYFWRRYPELKRSLRRKPMGA
jgi:lipopolysaccharide export LptBFGC system permease protein LptF